MGSFFQDEPTKISAICTKPDKISLTDCLACSGCITSTEHKKFKVDTSFLTDLNQTYSFIISPHAKMNLSHYYPDLDYSTFEICLIKFLKEYFDVHMVIDTSYLKKGSEYGISSECPAVVLYIERVFPDLIPLLSRKSTFQQLAADYIRKTSGSIKNHKIVSIMQCYDKKDELKRDGTKIDYFLGTKEFYAFLKEKFVPTVSCVYDVSPWEISHRQNIEEICGLENCINFFKRAKREIPTGIIELRICKNGCIGGPAQLGDKNTQQMVGIKRNGSVLFETKERVFVRPKKKTFKVEW